MGHYCLGNLYSHNDDYLDYELAFTHFIVAAEAGVSNAMFIVSTAYEQGRGVQEDPVQAFVWAKKEYQASNSLDTTKRLAEFYERGYGTDIDLQKALELYIELKQLGVSLGMPAEWYDAAIQRVETAIATGSG